MTQLGFDALPPRPPGGLRALERVRMLRRIERVARVIGRLERRPDGPLRERAGEWLRAARAASTSAGSTTEEIDLMTLEGLEHGRQCGRVVARFESRSSPGTNYEVRRGGDGVLYCTCPSWLYQHAPAPARRPCKHLEQIR